MDSLSRLATSSISSDFTASHPPPAHPGPSLCPQGCFASTLNIISRKAGVGSTVLQIGAQWCRAEPAPDMGNMQISSVTMEVSSTFSLIPVTFKVRGKFQSFGNRLTPCSITEVSVEYKDLLKPSVLLDPNDSSSSSLPPLHVRYFANEPFADLHPVEGVRGVFIATLINGSVSENNMRSVITFDKGGTWELLQPPAADSLGGTVDCEVRRGFIIILG